jgi:Tfp pilus assembly protein PilF
MDSLNTLLHSEFFIATGYFDRLIYSLTELSEFHYTPSGRDIFKSTLDRYNQFFAAYVDIEFVQNEKNQFQIATFRKNIKAFHLYVEKFITLPYSSENKFDFIVTFINLTYDISHSLHNYVLKYTKYDIQYPRTSLVKEKNISIEHEEITISKQFFIDIDDLKMIQEELSKENQVDFLELKRDEKYEHFIKVGHLNFNEKNYERALENFYKAKNYKETAEVYTLLAWAYSCLNDLEKAKNYCLKAITKDPNYGPAYNDYGNYLLSSGHTADSFKWFELAKRAINYQNREYPYINSGRAYMNQQKYAEALREFSTALILAPYHEELHDTVKKIKLNLDRHSNSKHAKPIEENFNETY